jgi:hypothetical protein
MTMCGSDYEQRNKWHVKRRNIQKDSIANGSCEYIQIQERTCKGYNGPENILGVPAETRIKMVRQRTG